MVTWRAPLEVIPHCCAGDGWYPVNGDAEGVLGGGNGRNRKDKLVSGNSIFMLFP